ncbi:MAG TPA: type II toxin-antitoxin system RelE/ParE family toxin [Candidatus Kapabacteria bacterium]|nr:type II toxin-antitoxin system RelE/ParE family toxin [Candidatus Kapabacteria bacterium]
MRPDTGRSLGGGIFKIRLAIKSKGKGKSGGARVITAYFSKETVLYLLTIYDKSDQESISGPAIDDLLQAALAENPVE